MDESAGTPHHDPRYFVNPFILNTDDGKYLVLKAIKLCNVRTLDCMKRETSCVLKVEKPRSPCPMSSSPETNKCYMQPQQRQNQPSMTPLRFIDSNQLSNLFSASADKGSRVLNQ